MDWKKRAQQLKTDLPAIWIALRDPDTPFVAKILAGVTVGYALSPIDLIPDFIPVLGYLDDLIILPLLVVWTIKHIPPDVLARSREQAVGLWANGKPKRWYYAVPVALLWLLIAWLIVKAIWF